MLVLSELVVGWFVTRVNTVSVKVSVSYYTAPVIDIAKSPINKSINIYRLDVISKLFKGLTD